MQMVPVQVWTPCDGASPMVDQSWQQPDSHWPVMWQTQYQMGQEALQDQQDQKTEEPDLNSEEMVLPVRTGASRRQRRLRMLQLRELQELEELQAQQEMSRPRRQEKKTKMQPKISQWTQWFQPQDHHQIVPDEAVRRKVPLTPLRLSKPPKLAGDGEDTDTPGSDCSNHLAADTMDSLPSCIFPPTPEHTPSNSPRLGADTLDSLPSITFPTLDSLPSIADTSLVTGSASHAKSDSMSHMGAASSWAPSMSGGVRPRHTDAECDVLLRQLDADDLSERKQAIKSVTELAWPLAASTAGCRVVQHALDLATDSERVTLAEQLKGRVVEALMCPHANHVLQKCVELLPAESLQFVIDEMHDHVVVAARHRYGCRVLERLIERAWQTESLVDDVLADTNQLCRHPFGNFVVQHVLKLGTARQKRSIVGTLHADIQRLARHRVASHVVRCALVNASEEDRQLLIGALTADPEDLADLAHHHCGSYVVRQLRKDVRR